VVLTVQQKTDLQSLVPAVPAILATAVDDWATFRAGVDAGLFSQDARDRVITWFDKWPRFWEMMRPNFVYTPQGLLKAHTPAIVAQADRFVVNLTSGEPVWLGRGLGLPPLIIIAGILLGGIALTAGVTAVIWAIGWVKEQNNIHSMIEAETAGRLPAGTTQEYIERDRSSVFGGFADALSSLGSLGKIALVAGLLYLTWPLLSPMFRSLGRKVGDA